MIVISEAQLLMYLLTWTLSGFAPFIIILILLKMSPGWAFFTSWILRKPLVLTKRKDGQWEAISCTYRSGMLIAKNAVYQPTTDGTDIGTIGSVKLGITSEEFGATISPHKVRAIELWKKAGLNTIVEAELFSLYVKDGSIPEKDYELIGNTTVSDAIYMLKEQYSIKGDSYESVKDGIIKRFEELKEKITTDENAQVFYKPGKGLFANVGYIVDYNAIKGWELQYARPDLVKVNIAVETEAQLKSRGDVVPTAIKLVSLGIMVFLVLLGAKILLNI